MLLKADPYPPDARQPKTDEVNPEGWRRMSGSLRDHQPEDCPDHNHAAEFERGSPEVHIEELAHFEMQPGGETKRSEREGRECDDSQVRGVFR